MNKTVRVAAKDISDTEIITAIVAACIEHNTYWAMRWDLEERLPQYPPKVITAKCRSLMKRGIIDGCPCGCRGDWEIKDYAETLEGETGAK